MKLCCLLTLPAAVGMSALAEPISLFLYGTGKAAYAIAHSGPAIWLLGLHQITTGVLQGIGKINIPMMNMLAGLAAKIAAVWFLTDAARNIAGAAWATNINFGLAALLNILVLRHLQITFNWYGIIKIGGAALLMGAAARWAYPLMAAACGKMAALPVILLLAAAFYGLLLVIFGVVRKEDLRQLPLWQKLKAFRKKA